MSPKERIGSEPGMRLRRFWVARLKFCATMPVFHQGSVSSDARWIVEFKLSIVFAGRNWFEPFCYDNWGYNWNNLCSGAHEQVKRRKRWPNYYHSFGCWACCKFGNLFVREYLGKKFICRNFHLKTAA